MDGSNDLVEIKKVNPISIVEEKFLEIISDLGLPSKDVFVCSSERQSVFQNTHSVLRLLPEEKRSKAIYISKFIAAAFSGLFDAALNYLWDETIRELRDRVSNYDLAYFYDITIQNPERRNKLNTPDDLMDITDNELIQGANSIGLITDIGYKHLDLIRYMRNYASAAHPNQNEITGLQLITWLETCIREVIGLPNDTIVAEIGKLLKNIKTQDISDPLKTASFFSYLNEDRVKALVSGFFGIYVDMKTNEQTRNNIRLLLPNIWDSVPEETRNKFGIQYARFVANNDTDQAKYAREFLDIVDGFENLPEPIRISEIDSAIQDLVNTHNSMNNFYYEPSSARRLKNIIKSSDKIPDKLKKSFVDAIVYVFITNGHGTTWNADSIYIEMIKSFTPEMSQYALLSFRVKRISNKLQHVRCSTKWREMLTLIKEKIIMKDYKNLYNEILITNAPLDKLGVDSKIQILIKKVLN